MRIAFGKIFLAVVLTTWLSIAVIGTVGFGEEQAAENTGILRMAHDALVLENNLYALLDDKLVSFTQDQEETSVVLRFSDYPEISWYSSLLFSDGTDLYILDPRTEAVYRIEDTTLEQIVILDVAALKQDFEDASKALLFQYPVIQNGFLYVLCLDDSDYSNDLYRFSLEDGKSFRLSSRNYAFQELVAYREGQLLGLDFDTQKIVVIDSITGKTVGEIGESKGYYIRGIAYDRPNDKVYSLCDAEVVRWENKNPVTVGYLMTGDVADVLCVDILNGQYAIIDRTGVYVNETVSSTPDVKPVTIWSSVKGILDSEILSDYAKLYQNAPPAIRYGDDNNENDKEYINTVCITGDASVDIFIVMSHNVDGEELFGRGYAAQLDSTVLENDVDTMYPQIRDYLVYHDALLGFPVDLWPKYWTVNTELLAEAHLDEIPVSLDDYYDMMLSWYEENYGSNPAVGFSSNQTVREEWIEAIYWITSQYIYTYASDSKPLSFNTPEFRAILEKVSMLSKWKGEDTLRDYSKEERRCIFNSNTLDPFALSQNHERSEEQCIIPPSFSENSQPVLDTSMAYFIVNPHSQNKDAAIKFIEFFSQNMQIELKYMLHPNDNELVERYGYQSIEQAYIDSIETIKSRMSAVDDKAILLGLEEELAQEEADFARHSENRWKYSADVIAEYRKLAPYISMKHNSLIWEIFNKIDIERILMGYFEGLTPLDQALTELDRRASILFLEAH